MHTHKIWLAVVTASALVLAFASVLLANPKVKFSEGSDASVDIGSVDVTTVGGGQPTNVNLESYNTDVEVIAVKKLKMAVTNNTIHITTTGTANANSTITVSCSEAGLGGQTANCHSENDAPFINQPGGGNAGVATVSADSSTGDIIYGGQTFQFFAGFANFNHATGHLNAQIAETGAAVNATQNFQGNGCCSPRP